MGVDVMTGESAMIWVTARFSSSEPELLIPLLRILANHSRGEPGCIAYDYYHNGDTFTSIECWETAEAERAHNQTEFLDQWLNLAAPLLTGKADVTRWTKI